MYGATVESRSESMTGAFPLQGTVRGDVVKVRKKKKKKKKKLARYTSRSPFWTPPQTGNW